MFGKTVTRQREKEAVILECPDRSALPHQSGGCLSGDLHRYFGCAGIYCLFILAVVVCPVQGEGAVLKLTLDDAVRLVLQQNPQVQIAGINLAQSEKDKDISRSFLLPNVSGEVSETVRRSNFEAFTGRTIPGFPKEVGPFSVFQGGGSFSVPVFDLTLWRRWQAAKETVGGMELQVESVQEQITLLVVSQYLGCLRENANVAAIRSRVGLAQALYQLAEDVQANGVGTRIDTLRARVTLQNEKQRLIVAETQLKTYIYTLAQLLNIGPQITIELVDTMEFTEVPETEESEDLARAYSARPEMQALDARIRATERDAQRVRSCNGRPADRKGGRRAGQPSGADDVLQ